ncbi:MAG: 2'-5' RNA ligase family protein [Microcoleaceae cyanobacterium]
MTKSRLFFIALLPPAEIQSEITQIKQYFAQNYDSRHALKSPPHITLQSPFKWLISDLNRLEQSLKTFAAQQAFFPVTLSGFNAFPPRVIYVDVVKTTELMNLQNNLVADLLYDLGDFNSRSSHHRFTPHMTVAFRDLTRENFRAGWTEFKNKPIQYEFVANQLTLLIHTGKYWQVEQEYLFGKSGQN